MLLALKSKQFHKFVQCYHKKEYYRQSVIQYSKKKTKRLALEFNLMSMAATKTVCCFTLFHYLSSNPSFLHQPIHSLLCPNSYKPIFTPKTLHTLSLFRWLIQNPLSVFFSLFGFLLFVLLTA